MKDIEVIKLYFRNYDNVDQVKCGCGCNQYIDVVHGLVQRIERDIMFILTKGEKG